MTPTENTQDSNDTNPKPKRLQVLDVGAGPESLAPIIFGLKERGFEYDVTTVDIDPDLNPTYVHDLTEPLPEELRGKFDLILASHVMEHIPRVKVLPTFKNIVEALAPGGEIWVLVPSLEWCAEQILNNQNIHTVLLCLYGGPDDFMGHPMGFTFPLLRDMLHQSGLIVRKAYQTPFSITVTNPGREPVDLVAMQNVVIGLKIE